MTTQPPRSYTKLAIAIIIAAVLVSAAIYATLGQSPKTLTRTSTSTVTESTTESLTTTETATTTSAVSSGSLANGLDFTMVLNSTSLQRGSNLTVSVSLHNSLEWTDNVSGATDWRLTDQSEAGPSYSCAQNDPFRIEVLRGYYDMGNFSQGTPLVSTVFLPPLGFNQCLGYIVAANHTAPPLFFSLSNNYYVFMPMSDEAQWIATGPQQANQLAVMDETMFLKPVLFSNSTGAFTVVGGDEWGDLQIAHYTVKP